MVVSRYEFRTHDFRISNKKNTELLYSVPSTLKVLF